MAGGSVIPVAELKIDCTVFSLSWIPSSARIVAVGASASGDGILKVYSMNGRTLSETGSASFDRPLRCGTFDACDLSERIYCLGDFGGFLSLVDADTLQTVHATRAHTDLINSISGGGVGSTEILTGGRDGEMKLWDRRTMDSPAVRMFPEAGESRRDCWTVSHSGHDTRILAAGFDNGDVKLFDLRSMKLSWETSLSRGVSSISLQDREESTWLVAGTSQGRLYQWNAKAPSATLTSQLDKSTVWSTQMVSDSGIVMNSLGSGAVSVCSCSEQRIEKICSQQVSESPLASLAASRDKAGLVAAASFTPSLHLLLYTGKTRS